MTIDAFLPRLDGVRPRGAGKYSARCPSHQDKNSSLSIFEGERGLLVKCWGGCTLDEFTAVLGIEIKDLFFDTATTHGRRPAPKRVKIHRVALAFHFELAALDRRLRAERIFSSAPKVTPDQLNDHDLDHALGLIEQGHKDITKDELLEGVTDDLRMKEFLKRDHEQQRRVA